jgi:threonine/homoserine/homoserine lactone efflux protein
MTFDPLYPFVFAGLFSPGPNVILLTASGARFGFRRTIPHVAGVVIGVGIVAGLTGLGIGALVLAAPVAGTVLRVLAAAWILWMAWTLFQSTRRPETRDRDRPFTLVEAALFQWINPKLWAVALAASSGYAIGLEPLDEAVRLGTAFSSINLGVCLFWTLAGSLLAYLLAHPSAWKLFMRIMAALLAVSAGMVFL